MPSCAPAAFQNIPHALLELWGPCCLPLPFAPEVCTILGASFTFPSRQSPMLTNEEAATLVFLLPQQCRAQRGPEDPLGHQQMLLVLFAVCRMVASTTLPINSLQPTGPSHRISSCVQHPGRSPVLFEDLVPWGAQLPMENLLNPLPAGVRYTTVALFLTSPKDVV